LYDFKLNARDAGKIDRNWILEAGDNKKCGRKT